MAKKTSKKTSTKSGGGDESARGKKLVIVESPAKARTINRYLGPDYVVKASVGHVRDLPAKSKKGEKTPVPGVDLEHGFTPHYEVLKGKGKVITELKRAAKQASEVWFATDLDREGEAIAWHIADELGIDPRTARRVVFNAITKSEVARAFDHPHAIDMNKVDAQQARRILDRIVGYQVSPLLWKKVARGLSAGRVQSIAVRLVVERERQIRAFIPEESWRMIGRFALDPAQATPTAGAWRSFVESKDEKGATPTIRAQNAWLAEHGGLRGELVQIAGESFNISQGGVEGKEPADLSERVEEIARLAGLTDIESNVTEDESGKGPARFVRTISGRADPSTPYAIRSIETKRVSVRPPAPFITSTLQQAASSRLGFGAQRTMRAAQRLYEGVEIKGEGSVGLITYMRTDSTHLAGDAIEMARSFVEREMGSNYLPEKPNFFTSSNKAAQEAHEAIRPTSLDYDPKSLSKLLKADEFKLYRLIWERFVSCQMANAQWDSTTVLLEGGTDPAQPLTFKATGRAIVFDGFYRVAGIPTASDEQTLPQLEEGHAITPFSIDPEQRFSSPPPRYTEASLIKMLESEGIGRPSTYASIISVIQDRKYVEQIERRFYATDLGEVVTDKLIEAFPELMEVSYTREMEAELDHIEDEKKDWVDVLEQFYSPFKLKLERAHDELVHAKAETQPSEYECSECGAPMVYRFGKNGRFLSCSRYPDCSHAMPVDREGKPRTAEYVNIRCPKTGRPMTRRTGRFGPFISTLLEDGEDQDVGMILNIDKKGHVKAPAPPPVLTDLDCEKCGSKLNLRDGVRGPWLGCSTFPKCRGRGKWSALDDATSKKLETQLKNLLRENPIPIISTLDGTALTNEKGQPLPEAPTVDDLLIDDPSEVEQAA